jgi:hypothetical protein
MAAEPISDVPCRILPRKKSAKYETTQNHLLGRAVAQAVSYRLSNAAVRVQARIKSRDGQSNTGASFLRVFRFPC